MGSGVTSGHLIKNSSYSPNGAPEVGAFRRRTRRISDLVQPYSADIGGKVIQLLIQPTVDTLPGLLGRHADLAVQVGGQAEHEFAVVS